MRFGVLDEITEEAQGIGNLIIRVVRIVVQLRREESLRVIPHSLKTLILENVG